jgi:hypothetical protein
MITLSRDALAAIRSMAAGPFEEARQLAQVSLHKFTPPYPGMGARVVKGGLLIYPVPIILNAKKDYRGNRLVEGRHVVSVVDDLWAAVERFVDQLLDVFCPRRYGSARRPR